MASFVNRENRGGRDGQQILYDETFAAHPPAARLRPGDTVITKLLYSRGRDETGKVILDGDNVLTGPFFIEGGSQFAWTKCGSIGIGAGMEFASFWTHWRPEVSKAWSPHSAATNGFSLEGAMR